MPDQEEDLSLLEMLDHLLDRGVVIAGEAVISIGGVHLRREDVEPLATPIAAGELFFSAVGLADDQPLGDRELLLRVAHIRAELLERATFIAVRYGYTFAREVETAQLVRWKRILEANPGHVEMTLKVAAVSPHARPDR